MIKSFVLLFVFFSQFPSSFLNVHSFKVDFVQKTESPFFPSIEDRGFLIVDGCRFRFEYITNDKRLTIGDCKNIYQINEDDNSTLIFPYSKIKNNPFLSILLDRGNLKRNFLIKKIEGKEHYFRLVPLLKSDNMPFTVLKVLLNEKEDRIKKLELIDETGQVTVYTFSNFVPDYKANNSLFTVGGKK